MYSDAIRHSAHATNPSGRPPVPRGSHETQPHGIAVVRAAVPQCRVIDRATSGTQRFDIDDAHQLAVRVRAHVAQIEITVHEIVSGQPHRPEPIQQGQGPIDNRRLARAQR